MLFILLNVVREMPCTGRSYCPVCILPFWASFLACFICIVVPIKLLKSNKTSKNISAHLALVLSKKGFNMLAKPCTDTHLNSRVNT